ncbi:hypothetical protein CHLRE_03g146807v5 [Chlamydomonas reinhardtii]|uniref:Auto-transporter adhesin head GIN domain-containing protein n=1 Tax=Chlamydomonas reinhardtii TaxID=3055 RepID=A0A2K3DVI4_CHLRE|nr:uncharacterized protein CHLRE_03g146807v5 [Chlamydomonas reinhardtii]PNW84538.1 hypothetical protein CHLRE_03g146807v5 [Chlamydomonas reinhardtii]
MGTSSFWRRDLRPSGRAVLLTLSAAAALLLLALAPDPTAAASTAAATGGRRRTARQPLHHHRHLAQATDGGTNTTSTNSTANTTMPVAPPASSGGSGTMPPAATSNVTVAGATLPGDVTAVRSCLPFSILIMPANDGNSNSSSSGDRSSSSGSSNATILMSAEPGVINATDISYSVADGILALSLSQGYVTRHVINLTINTANTSSLRFVQNFGPGNIVVGPGFNVSDFSAAATSIGGVLVQGLTAGHAYITNTGTGTVALNGSLSGADVTAGGTAKVYLAGNTSGGVAVSLDGISTTWVQGGSDTSITGSANGLAKVVYSTGSCNVQSAFQSFFGVSIFGDPCQRASSTPSVTFSPAWSCGQRVEGQSSCPADLSQTSTSGVGLGSGTSGSGSTSSTPEGTSGGIASEGGGATNTVNGQPGTVTTGTFTTPGGSASAGGSVSGPGGTLTGQQSGSGGNAPTFSTSNLPLVLPGNIFGGNGLDPNFDSIFSNMANSVQSVSTGGGGGGTASVASVSSPEGTTTINSGGSGTASALTIPSTGSGLAIVSLTCKDPAATRAIFPPSTGNASAAGTSTSG